MGPQSSLHPILGNSNVTKMSHLLPTPGNALRQALGKLSIHPAHSSSWALGRSPSQRKMLSGTSGLAKPSEFARTMASCSLSFSDLQGKGQRASLSLEYCYSPYQANHRRLHVRYCLISHHSLRPHLQLREPKCSSKKTPRRP